MNTLQKRIGAGLLGTAMLVNMAGCKENIQKEFSGQVQAATIEEAATRAVSYEFYLSHKDFYEKTMKTFLQCENVDSNVVYSPVNVYIAMGMLARCTTGEAQQQILDLLGDETIDEVRDNIKYLFENLTIDEEKCITSLANSIWLNAGMEFNEEVIRELGEEYYTSTFSGAMGSEALNQMFQDWINDNTNGLLIEQIKDFKLDSNTVIALVSTIYYKVSWENEFDIRNTYEETFYKDGEEIRLDFLHNSSEEMDYYMSETFTAISIPTLNGAEWYFLPNEGYTNEDILEDEGLYELLGGKDSNIIALKNSEVDYSIPKLDVESKADIIEGLMELGVTDIFDSAYSDLFTIVDSSDVSVNQVIHAARLINDEDGVEAAAATVANVLIGVDITEPIRLRFDCNKPYVTVVTEYGVPIFTGIINNPQ